jgi:hypothetical protein
MIPAVVLDVTARTETAQDLVLLCLQLWRDQQPDVLTIASVDVSTTAAR